MKNLKIKTARYVDGSEVFGEFPRLLHLYTDGLSFDWGHSDRSMVYVESLIGIVEEAITIVDDDEDMWSDEDVDIITQSEWNRFKEMLNQLDSDVYISIEQSQLEL